MRRFSIGLVFAVAIAGCGGGTDDGPLVARLGRRCTVQFRRGDALGAGGDLPVSPTTGNINGAQVNLEGTLRAVGGGWIAVESAGRAYCIPRDAILLVEFPLVDAP